MKAKEELEFLVALIREYTEQMPQATKLAVMKHAQVCVDEVYKVLEDLHNIKTSPVLDETKENTSTE